MVVYCCASGCFGCVWTHLLQMQSGRCLGNVITSSFKASESNVRQFSWVVWRCVWSLPWRWCRGAFEGGSPLRKRLHWMRCIWTHLLQMRSGRCLGSVITSSFRASERNVRQFSWCGAAFLSGFGACSDGGLLLRKRLRPYLLQMQSGRCLGSVITSSFRASESNVRQFSWVVWRCVFVWFWGMFWWWFTVAEYK